MLLFKVDEAQAAEVFLASDETIAIAAHVRKNRCRKSLPKDLQRVDNIYVLSEEEKHWAFYSDKTGVVPTQSTN